MTTRRRADERTRRRRGLAIGTLVLALGVAASGQQPAAPSFKFERPIVTSGPGPRRLAVDVPLLAGVNARDLRDLRLHDSNGAEIGYLLVANPPAQPTYNSGTILDVAPTETRTRRTSAFEVDLRERMVVDRFRVDGLPAPFLKRVTLEASGDRAHWTLLVPDGTMFDLPADRLQQTELRFAAGTYQYLRLTWDDTNSGRLPHPDRALAGQPGPVAPPPLLTTPLAFERRPGEPGRSYFRIRLPGGHLPIAALDLDVGGGHVYREAVVYEARLAGSELAPVVLGRASLKRVVANGVTAAALRIPIEAPSDAQLELALNDGDNPPLDLRGVTAVFSELPWIYFESPGGAVTARYGHPTLSPPRYDIEAVREQVKIETVAAASWGEPSPRPPESTQAAASALPTTGAAVDAAGFRYLRAIPAGPAGLLAVPLDVAVLAHSAAGPRLGFVDVRVIDADNRQVPYVLERASEPIAIDAALERMTTHPKGMRTDEASKRQSVYRIKLPDRDVPELRLVLTTNARVFNRDVSVIAARESDARRRDPWVETLASSGWQHADRESAAAPLRLAVTAPHAEELFVVVDEGDNPPLPLDPPKLLFAAYRVRFFREANASLRLAYGRNDLARPQYDLALLGPQVLATAALEVTAAAEPPASQIKRVDETLVSTRLFWAVIGVAALALVGLIARLLKRA